MTTTRKQSGRGRNPKANKQANRPEHATRSKEKGKRKKKSPADTKKRSSHQRGQRSSVDAILAAITSAYQSSNDFNGVRLSRLGAIVGDQRLLDHVVELVERGKVDALWAGPDVNPAIKRFVVPDREAQLAHLRGLRAIRDMEGSHTFMYPSSTHLQDVVDRSRYAEKPYTLALALGERQLAHRSFDLSVLEFYRNDPRYFYRCDDVHGYISISDEHYRSEGMASRDKVLLQTFGFSYNEGLDRAVATFVRYLANLTPEHQQTWRAKELEGDYRLHPHFFVTQIVGDFPSELTLVHAFIMEMDTINKMVAAMGRPKLFREVPSADSRPKKLAFLLRPTLAEFNDSVLVLDKLLSDNIDKDFFQEEVPDVTEETGSDGRIRVQQKGTLQMLDQWFRKKFSTNDWKPFDKTMETLRKVRRLRQKPAHSLEEDAFDRKYFREQRQLFVDAYDAIRTIRLMLANHPATRAVEVNGFLAEGRICTY